MCTSWVNADLSRLDKDRFLGCFRDIKLNLRRNLVEVKHEKKEAVFELLDAEGKTETYNVSDVTIDLNCDVTNQALWSSGLKSGMSIVGLGFCPPSAVFYHPMRVAHIFQKIP